MREKKLLQEIAANTKPKEQLEVPFATPDVVARRENLVIDRTDFGGGNYYAMTVPTGETWTDISVWYYINASAAQAGNRYIHVKYTIPLAAATGTLNLFHCRTPTPSPYTAGQQAGGLFTERTDTTVTYDSLGGGINYYIVPLPRVRLTEGCILEIYCYFRHADDTFDVAITYDRSEYTEAQKV